MPLMPALRSQRQAYLCEFETNLVYRVSRGYTKNLSPEKKEGRRKGKRKETRGKGRKGEGEGERERERKGRLRKPVSSPPPWPLLHLLLPGSCPDFL